MAKDILCSVCGKSLDLSGVFWETFARRHPNLHHKGCKVERLGQEECDMDNTNKQEQGLSKVKHKCSIRSPLPSEPCPPHKSSKFNKGGKTK